VHAARYRSKIAVSDKDKEPDREPSGVPEGVLTGAGRTSGGWRLALGGKRTRGDFLRAAAGGGALLALGSLAGCDPERGGTITCWWRRAVPCPAATWPSRPGSRAVPLRHGAALAAGKAVWAILAVGAVLASVAGCGAGRLCGAGRRRSEGTRRERRGLRGSRRAPHHNRDPHRRP
jgi:hypothetical protein